MRRLTLYGRPGCCLCDEALAVIRRVQAEIPFELDHVDITSDEALHRAMFERIPVLALDGQELCDLLVPEALLRERLGSPPGEASCSRGPIL